MLNRNFIGLLLLSLLFITSCQTSTEVKKDEHAGHNQTNSNQSEVTKQPAGFSAEFRTIPVEVEAGKPTEFIFTVKNPSGEIVKDLQIVHEKPMHLLIVSEDLAEFYHEHPEVQADGTLKVSFTFKNGGKYKLYTDFTPKDNPQVVKSFSLVVTGTERPDEPLKVDTKFEKTVDGLFVTMKPDADLIAGKENMLNFQVFDANSKKPVTDLQNYLGELAHFVVVSDDLRDFVHAHPMSRDNVKDEHSHGEKLAGKEAESNVSAHLTFPKSGIYKIFAQFKRNDKVTTVPFVVEVKQEGDNAKIVIKPEDVPKDAYKITASKAGFTPNEVSIKKDSFKKLAFVRIDEENCANEVVFKSLNITKKLPLGKVVTIDLPKDFTGELSFACGMDMYKGKVIVE